ncbi:hypothetical protein MBRA1_002860 [Malassezia brasiliensis]|uniref:AMP-dependent synthetase/ligase domain-containing protein n=1 Tax=Malassezia brasiliensis TaxID=1821822 RepID=A0AAF0DY90_9BASI|nr:hypothetical protein MBRA1_002860 [Malassezia brasiliensis]
MYKSLYNEQKHPSDLSLPQFVFRYLEKDRNKVPVLHPSPFGSRPDSKPLTLLDVRDGAYAIAKSLLAPDLPGGPWKKGEVVLFLTENQKLLKDPMMQDSQHIDVPVCDPTKDVAVYCFSSGTSGAPKVVCLSHYNIVSNVIQTVATLGGRMNKPRFDDAGWYNQPLLPPQDGTDEFHLSILPQFHCYGLLMAVASLHTSTPCVIFSRFNVEHFFEAVQRYRVTFMFVVPPMLMAMATSPLAEKYDVSSIRSFASGAASLSKELCALVYKKNGIPVTDGYGMTEMSPLIALQTEADIKRHHLDVGRLVANTEARIIDIETGKDVRPGEAGELWLRGPQMMLGYKDNDEANAKAFVPNSSDPERFFRSGDVVSIDENGYLTIRERIKDVIKYNGYQISASELEDIVRQVDIVKDVAVVGKIKKGNITRNELPWAYVIVNDDAKSQPEEERTQKILDYVNSRVPPYKNAAGKVLKRELVDE